MKVLLFLRTIFYNASGTTSSFFRHPFGFLGWYYTKHAVSFCHRLFSHAVLAVKGPSPRFSQPRQNAKDNFRKQESTTKPSIFCILAGRKEKRIFRACSKTNEWQCRPLQVQKSFYSPFVTFCSLHHSSL